MFLGQSIFERDDSLPRPEYTSFLIPCPIGHVTPSQGLFLYGRHST